MRNLIFLTCLLLCLISCATTKKAVEIKDYQTKQYDKFSYKDVVNACLDTMNDLGFVISSFDGYTEIYSSFMEINIDRENCMVTLQARKESKGQISKDIQNEVAYKNFFNMVDKKLEEK